jgi:hypothetical protein
MPGHLANRWSPAAVVTVTLLATVVIAGPALGHEAEQDDAVSYGRTLPSADDGTSRTGSETALGMIASLGALGIGGGLVATARRRKQ